MGKAVCSWVRSVLVAYLDGELGSASAEAVRRHLKRCSSCRDHARMLESTWELLDANAGRPPIRSGFTRRMMDRLAEEQQWEQIEALRGRRRLVRRAAGALTGLAAGLLVGFAVYAWSGHWRQPDGVVEREVSRHVSFLEDVDLLDEVAVIEAMERLGEDRDEREDG